MLSIELPDLVNVCEESSDPDHSKKTDRNEFAAW